MDLGAFCFLIKPVKPDVLVRTIESSAVTSKVTPVYVNDFERQKEILENHRDEV